MGTPNFNPQGSYPNVTGVVDATAKTEITALITTLKTFIPSQPLNEPEGLASATPSPSPDFDAQRSEVTRQIHKEIAGVEAAIAAAPSA